MIDICSRLPVLILETCEVYNNTFSKFKGATKLYFMYYSEAAVQRCRHGCSPGKLWHIFRTPFPRNTSGRLPLIIRVWSLFCSVRVFISLHFLPILLVKQGFRLSVF